MCSISYDFFTWICIVWITLHYFTANLIPVSDLNVDEIDTIALAQASD